VRMSDEVRLHEQAQLTIEQNVKRRIAPEGELRADERRDDGGWRDDDWLRMSAGVSHRAASRWPRVTLRRARGNRR
jgi:hypothetical protein